MVIERARIIIGSLLVRIGAKLLDEGGPGAPFDDQAEDDDVGIPNVAASTVTEAGRAMIFTDDGGSQEKAGDAPALRGSLRARFGDQR